MRSAAVPGGDNVTARTVHGDLDSRVRLLITVQAVIPAALGALVGTLAGAALVIAMANNPPTPPMAAAVPLLAIISAAVGSLPAAALATLRDPVSVLRVP